MQVKKKSMFSWHVIKVVTSSRLYLSSMLILKA